MSPKGKRPAVPAKMYRDWLERSDQGETPPQISEADGYDVRTVRRNIDIAKQEREERKTRQMVFGRALEEHYRDLVKFAEELRTRLKHGPMATLPERKDPMWVAFKEHLPRSSIWRDIDRWEHHCQEHKTIGQAAIGRMEQAISRESPLGFSTGEQPTGFIRDDLAVLVLEQLQGLAEGGEPHFEIFDVPTPRGITEVVVNNRLRGRFAEEMVDAATKSLRDLERAMSRWPQVEALTRNLQERRRLEGNLDQELLTITLRRVVPGRCRYCPF